MADSEALGNGVPALLSLHTFMDYSLLCLWDRPSRAEAANQTFIGHPKVRCHPRQHCTGRALPTHGGRTSRPFGLEIINDGRDPKGASRPLGVWGCTGHVSGHPADALGTYLRTRLRTPHRTVSGQTPGQILQCGPFTKLAVTCGLTDLSASR